MKVKFEFKIIDLNKQLDKGHGDVELNDPIMIYAQIPIEREQYLKLIEECNERKTSIYELLQCAVNQNSEDIDIW